MRKVEPSINLIVFATAFLIIRCVDRYTATSYQRFQFLVAAAAENCAREEYGKASVTVSMKSFGLVNIIRSMIAYKVDLTNKALLRDKTTSIEKIYPLLSIASPFERIQTKTLLFNIVPAVRRKTTKLLKN